MHSCTHIHDAWTEQKRSIITLALILIWELCFMTRRTLQKDIHDGLFIYNLINSIIEKIEGGIVV